jgi:hypothetical protein
VSPIFVPARPLSCCIEVECELTNAKDLPEGSHLMFRSDGACSSLSHLCDRATILSERCPQAGIVGPSGCVDDEAPITSRHGASLSLLLKMATINKAAKSCFQHQGTTRGTESLYGGARLGCVLSIKLAEHNRRSGALVWLGPQPRPRAVEPFSPYCVSAMTTIIQLNHSECFTSTSGFHPTRDWRWEWLVVAG